MSNKERVDTMVLNFKDKLKASRLDLDNNINYASGYSGPNSVAVTLNTNTYMMLQKSYNSLVENVTELNNIITSERENLRKNEETLKNNKNMIDMKDDAIMNGELLLNEQHKLMNSREYQYELAVKRNEHRRQMVIMLALLNTLGLSIYYFVSK